jgi:hypothetical protein
VLLLETQEAADLARGVRFEKAAGWNSAAVAEQLESVSEFFKRNKVSGEFRKEVLASAYFDSLAFETRNTETVLYRWHTTKGEAKGFYYTPDVYPDAETARAALAIASDNTMENLSRVSPTEEIEFLCGKVAPLNGHAGGGRQCYTPHFTKLRFEDVQHH